MKRENAIAYQEKVVNKIEKSVFYANGKPNIPQKEKDDLKAKLEVNKYILDVLRGTSHE